MECAEEMRNGIKTFETTKTVSVKNRYPRTSLLEYTNLDKIVLEKCRKKRLMRESIQHQ